MKKIILGLQIMCILSLIHSCAPDIEMTSTFNWTEFRYEDDVTIYGFGGGFLHGILIPFELIGTFINWLFDFNWNIGIWADVNNGIRYWLGYVIGGSLLALMIAYIIPKTKSVCIGKKEKHILFWTTYTNEYQEIPIQQSIIIRNIIFATSFVWLTFFAAFTKNVVFSPDVPKLNRAQVMNILSNKSLKDGAYYYLQRRDKYDFFDELYCDSIVPIILEGNFADLKNVYDIVKDTPAGDILGPWYEEGKEVFKQELFNKLDSLTAESKIFLKTEMPSYLSLVIDSILEKDTHKIVEGYCGGIMNYKKLNLLFERDKNFAKFSEYTTKVLENSNYENCLTSYCDSYIASIANLQQAYYYELSDKRIKSVNASYPGFAISDDVSELQQKVELLTDDECDEVIVDIFKDGVIPITLILATGGTYAIVEGVYTAGTIAYDAAKVYNDIKNNRLSFNEKLELYLAQHLQYRLEAKYSIVETSVVNAIDANNIAVKRAIEEAL